MTGVVFAADFVKNFVRALGNNNMYYVVWWSYVHCFLEKNIDSSFLKDSSYYCKDKKRKKKKKDTYQKSYIL